MHWLTHVSIGNFEQDQFEKFLAAVRITSHETDVGARFSFRTISNHYTDG